MKILAIIYQSNDAGHESYGYDIWKIMKEQFHTYLNDNDIGNVYHHLNDLCALNYLYRADEEGGRCCYYRITEDGIALKSKYDQYLDIMKTGD